MEVTITDDMIDGFNDILKDRESIVRIERNDYNGKSVHIVFREDELVNTKYHPLNVSDKMIRVLKSYFKNNYGVENLYFNNTRTSFWIG